MACGLWLLLGGCSEQDVKAEKESERPIHSTLEDLKSLKTSYCHVNKMLDNLEVKMFSDNIFDYESILSQEDKQLIDYAYENLGNNPYDSIQFDSFLNYVVNITQPKTEERTNNDTCQAYCYYLRKKVLQDFSRGEDINESLKQFLQSHELLSKQFDYNFKPPEKLRLKGQSIDGGFNKGFKVTLITPDNQKGIDIRCPEDITILEAAEEAGIDLPYCTRVGCSSASAALLIMGSVDQSDQSFLDDDQLDEGFVLLSVAYPLSDCCFRTHMEKFLYSGNPVGPKELPEYSVTPPPIPPVPEIPSVTIPSVELSLIGLSKYAIPNPIKGEKQKGATCVFTSGYYAKNYLCGNSINLDDYLNLYLR